VKFNSPRKQELNKQKEYELLMKHFCEVCEPYEFEKENATNGNIELVRKLTDCINDERSLMKFVKLFKNNSKDCDGDVDEDEDCDDDETSEEEAVACATNGDNINIEIPTHKPNTNLYLAYKKNKKPKYVEWRMDALRRNDLNTMRAMTKDLGKLRKDDRLSLRK
jgi:hypothetical protein